MHKPDITLYNYRSRSLEVFSPARAPIGLYTCGPTVYNTAHIGNLRTYIFEDILKRTLEYFGYGVNHVMNLTDVEDKIIRDAGAAQQDIVAFTAPFTERFHADLAKLNIRPATTYPKATDHIAEMIALIKQLEGKGVAYVADGSVYFSIAKYPNYGRLAGIDLGGLKAGARVDNDEYDKEAAQDFVLWKAAKPEDEAVGAVWDSPWGKGRPGWHIECSAMSMKYLGETFDLHVGAIDLLFPHHEDEIAQSEAATGVEFARFFLEAEHLLVDGHKMAKSAKNFYTLDDIEQKGISPRAFRYLVLTSHYRSKLNFTWDSLQAAENALKHLDDFQYRDPQPPEADVIAAIDAKLANDLDTPGAIALLHEQANSALWARYEPVLGLGFRLQSPATAPAAIQALADEREAARTARDFTQADELRQQIDAAGWLIEDTPSGPKLLPKH